jgi:hypothetical protein
MSFKIASVFCLGFFSFQMSLRATYGNMLPGELQFERAYSSGGITDLVFQTRPVGILAHNSRGFTLPLQADAEI